MKTTPIQTIISELQSNGASRQVMSRINNSIDTTKTDDSSLAQQYHTIWYIVHKWEYYFLWIVEEHHDTLGRMPISVSQITEALFSAYKHLTISTKQ